MERLIKFFKDNSLSLAFFSLYLICAVGQAVTGVHSFNSERASHGLPTVDLRHFLATGTFFDGLFVNLQAAVLQLAVLILFGSVLRQKGATHSKKEEGEAGHEDEDHNKPQNKDKPKRSWLSRNSLSLVFLSIFVVSFTMHIVYGTEAQNEERALMGEAPLAISTFVTSATFWTDTLACWQAEFFAIFAYVIFSIFLRQENSPESKPENSSDQETGESNK